jgi:hypothetical protein
VVGGDEQVATQHVLRRRLLLTPTMNNQPRSITLFCWILNLSNRSFPIDIDESRTVGHLKKDIVKEKPTTFATIEADLLEIQKVSATFTSTLATSY